MSIIPAKIVCDLCGADDDFNDEQGPYFTEGVEIGIRGDNMLRKPVLKIDICLGCRDKLFEAFPKLLELFEITKYG